MTMAEKIALWNMLVTSLGVLLAPLVALWIGGILQRRADRRREKLQLLSVLLSVRHTPFTPEAVKPLNMIDAVFSTDIEVREAWSRYYAALNDPRNNNPAGYAQWDEKKRELILTMARKVGLGKAITTSDVLRTYQPTFMGKQERLSILDLDIRLAQAEAAARQLGLAVGDVTPPSPTPPPQPPSAPPTEPEPVPQPPRTPPPAPGPQPPQSTE
jgi:hypothetical protein